MIKGTSVDDNVESWFWDYDNDCECPLKEDTFTDIVIIKDGGIKYLDVKHLIKERKKENEKVQDNS